jgi:predicted hotdog family 3-hydroxylacyl-ACP dehydratase
MCLLEKIESWNENEIACTATSHLNPDNPLKLKGRLHIIHGVEYAAQAMAVHGKLLNPRISSSPGLLASTKNLRFNAHRLDNIKVPLRIHARSLAKTIHGLVYSFTVSDENKVLISGECTIVFPSIDG